MSNVTFCPILKQRQKEKCDDHMPNRHNGWLQEMPGIFNVPPKNCHRRLREARERANQTASGQRKKEVANRDTTIACYN
jgi:hypothetical protein